MQGVAGTFLECRLIQVKGCKLKFVDVDRLKAYECLMSFQPSCSFVDLINDCDNVHLSCQHELGKPSILIDASFGSEHLVPWYISCSSGNAAIGLLRPVIVDELCKDNELRRGNGKPELWNIERHGETQISRITFQPWVDTASKRTAEMKELCERWRDTGLFEDVCGPKKWREEMYPVYSRPFGIHDHPSKDLRTTGESETNYAFEMERSACALFGVITYGVHMTVFQEIQCADSRETKTWVWVPRRAKTKQTCEITFLRRLVLLF